MAPILLPHAPGHSRRRRVSAPAAVAADRPGRLARGRAPRAREPGRPIDRGRSGGSHGTARIPRDVVTAGAERARSPRCHRHHRSAGGPCHGGASGAECRTGDGPWCAAARAGGRVAGNARRRVGARAAHRRRVVPAQRCVDRAWFAGGSGACVHRGVAAQAVVGRPALHAVAGAARQRRCVGRSRRDRGGHRAAVNASGGPHAAGHRAGPSRPSP